MSSEVDSNKGDSSYNPISLDIPTTFDNSAYNIEPVIPNYNQEIKYSAGYFYYKKFQ